MFPGFFWGGGGRGVPVIGEIWRYVRLYNATLVSGFPTMRVPQPQTLSPEPFLECLVLGGYHGGGPVS